MESPSIGGSRLYIGHSDPTFIPKNPITPPGTSILNGPVIIGGFIDGQLPPPLSVMALCNIITPATVTADLPPFPTGMTPLTTAGLKISALGDGAVPYPGPGILANAVSHVISAGVPVPPAAVGLNLLSATMTTLTTPVLNINANTINLGTYNSVGARTKAGAETQSGAKAETGAKADTGARCEAGAAAQNATVNVAATITSPTITTIFTILGTKKSFDIVHPNKPGYRLRHACIEGPEAAVYVRGKLVNSNIIELPDYWNGLIDPETITVNLTQIGHSQDLMVEKIEWGKKIIIKSGNGTSINCYYQILADRLGEKLIVEYEGQTPQDYPGNADEYSVAGWNYDRRI
jgi:hypothetical protein